MADIKIPDFEFGAFYYPEILESLTLYKRRNVPELTDESEFEPFQQLLRAFALVGHLNNVLLDQLANESTLPTARLPATVRNQLRLINYELQPATPSQADLVYKLSRTFAVTTEVAPAASQFATRRGSGDEPVLFFEDLAGTSVDRTDQIGAALEETSGGSFVDHTAAAISGAGYSPTINVGSKLYFGHSTAMFDKLTLNVNAASNVVVGVWEFYDGDVNDVAPDSVSSIGNGKLRMEVNGLLGVNNRAGATVTVRLNSSGASEVATSTWNGTKNIVDIGLLGQSSPSTDRTEYTVGSEWRELEGVVDDTVLLTETGENDVEFTLPQTESLDWNKTTINGFEGFFIRFRPVEVSSSSAPEQGAASIDGGGTYAKASIVQGRTVSNETLGSSNGSAGQRFETQRDNFVLGSQVVFVDAEQWTKVDSFLNSLPQDKHYKLELSDDDRAVVIFGNGIQGAIPPIGQSNIVANYRYGAQDDGNVGARTVVVDKTGLTNVNALWNPRQAGGWSKAQSADKASLEQAKELGPATLRTKEVAVGPDDVRDLALLYVDSNGSKPYGRAYAIEEGFGPKTIELVLVLKGGGLASSNQLQAVQDYFNGTATMPKRVVANQEVVASNYQPRAIDLVAVVEDPSGNVTSQQVANALAVLLRPEALLEDGVTWRWNPGDEIPVSRLEHEIYAVDKRITEVVITTPASKLVLSQRELPTPGIFSISVVKKI